MNVPRNSEVLFEMLLFWNLLSQLNCFTVRLVYLNFSMLWESRKMRTLYWRVTSWTSFYLLRKLHFSDTSVSTNFQKSNIVELLGLTQQALKSRMTASSKLQINWPFWVKMHFLRIFTPKSFWTLFFIPRVKKHGVTCIFGGINFKIWKKLPANANFYSKTAWFTSSDKKKCKKSFWGKNSKKLHLTSKSANFGSSLGPGG